MTRPYAIPVRLIRISIPAHEFLTKNKKTKHEPLYAVLNRLLRVEKKVMEQKK